MQLEAILAVRLAVADLASVIDSYRRIGLEVRENNDQVATFTVGSSVGLFQVHLVPTTDKTGLTTLEFAVVDLDALANVLEQQGISLVRHADEEAVFVLKESNSGLCSDLLFHRSRMSALEQFLQAQQEGLLEHRLPLQRLDHLASVAADLEPASRFWTETMRVAIYGEVKTPNMVIRQLKIGGTMLELLGAIDDKSPVWQRQQGLISMASWQVADLDAVVAQVRAAGFTVSDAAKGMLPGTRIATVAGAELGGMNIQLLQYV